MTTAPFYNCDGCAGTAGAAGCPIHNGVSHAAWETVQISHARPQPHVCPKPDLGRSLTGPQRPDWECGECGRVFRHVVDIGAGWWAEVRGPSHHAKGTDA